MLVASKRCARLRRPLLGGAWIVVLVLPVATQADEDILRRQTAAAHALSSANALSMRHGRYARAREALVGPGGLGTQVDRWLTDAFGWVEGWLRAMAVAQVESDEMYQALQARLAEILEEQTRVLFSLERRAGELAAQGRWVVGLGTPGGPYRGVDSLGPVMDGLGQREAELREATGRVASLPSTLVPELSRIDEVSRPAVVARLRASLLASGRYPVEQAVQGVQALLDAEGRIGRSLAELSDMERTMARFAMNLQIHHAEQLAPQAREACARARGIVESIVQPAWFGETARRRVRSRCGSIEQDVDSLRRLPASKWDLVHEHIAIEKDEVVAQCRSRPVEACERLAVLASYDTQTTRSLTAAELRLMEFAWEETTRAVRGMQEHR